MLSDFMLMICAKEAKQKKVYQMSNGFVIDKYFDLFTVRASRQHRFLFYLKYPFTSSRK